MSTIGPVFEGGKTQDDIVRLSHTTLSTLTTPTDHCAVSSRVSKSEPNPGKAGATPSAETKRGSSVNPAGNVAGARLLSTRRRIAPLFAAVLSSAGVATAWPALAIPGLKTT